MRKCIFPILAIVAVLLGTISPAAHGDSVISAETAILIDGKTGTVLFEKNADTRMLIASTTKILTALVVLEKCSVDEAVTIKPEYTYVEGSSIYLRAGEVLSVQELLYGMMLSSGNDAAAALAYHTAGSIPAFAEMMNQKVRELGLANSSFKNPHGLDAEGHYSTARDMALITAEAMRNEAFVRIVSTKNITVAGRSLQNHNKMLWRYEGALGVKTGYTKSAGRSLVSCAERDGMRLICVTLNAPDDWDDHSRLFDWGFTNYHYEDLVIKGEYSRIPVISGTAGMVGVAAGEGFGLLVKEGDQIEVLVELPRFVYANVDEGDAIGKISVLRNGEIIKVIPLTASETVSLDSSMKLTPFERIKRKFSF